MPKNVHIRLAFAVHKVTELFPSEEPLKYNIRELADEILVDLINDNYEQALEGIKNLNVLFNTAEARNFIDPRNFIVLRREYAKIIQDNGINSGKPVENSFPAKSYNKKRKEEILGILKENGKVKIGDLRKNFPDITRRTLLRDLEEFCQVGLVRKNGNGRGACYKLINATL